MSFVYQSGLVQSTTTINHLKIKVNTLLLPLIPESPQFLLVLAEMPFRCEPEIVQSTLTVDDFMIKVNTLYLFVKHHRQGGCYDGDPRALI
jgi:hypothetical protein